MSLARRLLARSAPGALGADGERGLEGLLSQVLARSRARWPAVQLDDDAFLDHLSQLAPADVDQLATLQLEDLFLACACLRGDRAALADLDARILSQVPRWIAAIEGAQADEVQQALRRRLLLGPPPRLLAYRGRGALSSWIRVAATRCALDQAAAHQEHPAGNELEELWSHPDPELDFVKLHDRQALRAVLHEAMQALPARDRMLLRLHYAEGMTQDQLAGLKRVHRVTVARWLASARSRLQESARALLRERLHLSAAEGESLLRLLRSRLELSLQRALEQSRKTSAG